MTSLNLEECNKCRERVGIYKRNYSGEILCKACFLLSVESKVKKTMNCFSMVKHGDKLAVAVSGGKDSLTLLYILNKISQSMANTITAITVDEGIGGYRSESIQIVKEFCSNLNIENRIVSYEDLFGIGIDEAMAIRSSTKVTSCSVCGTFRRRAIDLLAEWNGANVVATGHNLDDHIQSFFINVFSGDVDRIGWSYPRPVEYGTSGIRKIKPLLALYEKEIIFYALHQNIPFQSLECPYMNESIRTEIRNFLNQLEETRPGIKYNIYNSVLKISAGLKSQTSHKGSTKCLVCQRQSTNKICSVCKTVVMLSGQSSKK